MPCAKNLLLFLTIISRNSLHIYAYRPPSNIFNNAFLRKLLAKCGWFLAAKVTIKDTNTVLPSFALRSVQKMLSSQSYFFENNLGSENIFAIYLKEKSLDVY